MELKFHYHGHKSLPLVPILSQINSICNVTPYFSNIILPSTHRSSFWIFQPNFCLNCLPMHFYISLTCTPWCNCLSNTGWREQIVKLLTRHKHNLKIISDFQNTHYKTHKYMHMELSLLSTLNFISFLKFIQ